MKKMRGTISAVTMSIAVVANIGFACIAWAKGEQAKN